jgi:hypothetical protein
MHHDILHYDIMHYAIMLSCIMNNAIRNIYGGLRTGLVLAAFGYIYQVSTNNNLTNSFFPN